MHFLCVVAALAQKSDSTVDQSADSFRAERSVRALENLQNLEASEQVYSVYEHFIVPRICKDIKRTGAGIKKSACRLLPFARPADFERLPGDPTGILYRAKKPLGSIQNYDFRGPFPNLIPAGPKNYRLTHVACYRRPQIRNQLRDCSLFFAVYESAVSGNAPIIAVKGSSNLEDWRNNFFAGAPILGEITHIFTRLLTEMRMTMIHSSQNQYPSELRGLSKSFSAFFLNLSRQSGRLFFTGHSLGGALAQELAREVFLATRNGTQASSGPKIRVITGNALSYTTLLGRLKQILHSYDPMMKAGWRQGDASQISEFRTLFDGRNLSAVNFYTADDPLTQIVNYGFVGRILRLKSVADHIHAGDDVLLASKRTLDLDSLGARITGHGTKSLLQDALFSCGGSFIGERVFVQYPGSQQNQLETFQRNSLDSQRRRLSPQYFAAQGFETEEFDRYDGINFDRLKVLAESREDSQRSELYLAMQKSLTRHARLLGRLAANRDHSSQLNRDLYR